METHTIGALVVGHAPRAEVTDALRDALGPHVTLKQRGALDSVAREDLGTVAPHDAADTLFTRLPDGTGVTLSKRAVTAYGDRELERLKEDGCSTTIVMCTGAFPEWEARHRILSPSRLLQSAVTGVLPAGRLGVLVPVAEQLDHLAPRWRELGYEVCAHALSPNADDATAMGVGEAIAAQNVDLLVFDCISYLRGTKRAVQAAAGVPGLLAIGLCARIAAELVD